MKKWTLAERAQAIYILPRDLVLLSDLPTTGYREYSTAKQEDHPTSANRRNAP